VLFSEPKIPQSHPSSRAAPAHPPFQCSSASRKFLNVGRGVRVSVGVRFQCSSASRKFLNGGVARVVDRVRAVSVLFSEPKIPQYRRSEKLIHRRGGFSALQRAENSSIESVALHERIIGIVSVLFSEPKIPQSRRGRCGRSTICCVSVLFSEPKIPQFLRVIRRRRVGDGFSALQRAENSSIFAPTRPERCTARRFQCSSASRKFLN